MADSETPYPRVHSSLRTLTTLSFLPAFPLCVAHGVLAHLPAPAVGLVPLAVSAAGSVVLIRSTTAPHPVAVFFFDLGTAAACMVVLVFTWVTKEGTPGLSMLAAYATIPLLFNFLIHFFLALESIYTGLAIHSLVQWIAWRALPPDCPHCNHHLRSDFPVFPWMTRLRQSRMPYADLFVDESERYNDEEAPLIDEDHITYTPQPEAVEVRRKDRKSNAVAPSSSSAESSNLPTIGRSTGSM